jgi:hypothetical protein
LEEMIRTLFVSDETWLKTGCSFPMYGDKGMGLSLSFCDMFNVYVVLIVVLD